MSWKDEKYTHELVLEQSTANGKELAIQVRTVR
jgi:hypothetical protein